MGLTAEQMAEVFRSATGEPWEVIPTGGGCNCLSVELDREWVVTVVDAEGACVPDTMEAYTQVHIHNARDNDEDSSGSWLFGSVSAALRFLQDTWMSDGEKLDRLMSIISTDGEHMTDGEVLKACREFLNNN